MSIYGEKGYGLPNGKILDATKSRAYAENSNEAQVMEFVFDMGENIVGKGENAGNQHFPFFQQCFQKASSYRSFKLWIVW